MQWLNKVIDEVVAQHPEGEIIVSSGVSPSGKYHLGTLREVLTAEVVVRELKRRGRASRHIHFVDDLDGLRKVPAGVPEDYSKYLGKPLYDIPAPGGSQKSYADYYLSDLLSAAEQLKLEMEVIRSHQKYQEGFFVDAIELALEHINDVRKILETVSGHKLGQEWSPIQVNEDGYLKKRKFVSIDSKTKTIEYLDKDGKKQTIVYDKGGVKLDWRIDWPARWWLLGVNVEPFGRDHATKGGSYDTGAALMASVFKSPPPLPIPYAFINRSGETKKMSKSAGDTVDLSQLLQVLPPEVVWYFVIRYAPEKQLFFDEGEGVVRLIDEFAELMAKPSKTNEEKQLQELCGFNINSTVSTIPFSHLVASYQASLKDPIKTLELLQRTTKGGVDGPEQEIIKNQLVFIDNWLQKWAPEDAKFDLVDKVDPGQFTDEQKAFLGQLADKIAKASADADGEWFHKAIYELKESGSLTPEQVFSPIYKALIDKSSGPRAGWFLSILPRDWLIKRLNLEA